MELHEIYQMMVDENGTTIGNKGAGRFRFIPRIGEHVYVKEGEEDHICEVVDVRHTGTGDMEIFLYDLGYHGSFWRKPTLE